MKHKITF